jgi:hypothetical protein
MGKARFETGEAKQELRVAESLHAGRRLAQQSSPQGHRRLAGHPAGGSAQRYYLPDHPAAEKLDLVKIVYKYTDEEIAEARALDEAARQKRKAKKHELAETR